MSSSARDEWRGRAGEGRPRSGSAARPSTARGAARQSRCAGDRYYSRDTENNSFGIVIVKATYEITPAGDLLAAEEQAPMLFTDKCHGDVNVSSLWHPSDLVPLKPVTDVIINGTATAPEGQSLPSWECSVAINDNDECLLTKSFRVTGPRSWEPQWKRPLRDGEAMEWRRHRHLFRGWELSEPEPVTSVPLRYEFAYGGVIEIAGDDGSPRIDTDHHNPLGRGRIDRDFTDHTKKVAAAQIEALDDPITDPYAIYRPVNVGPIPPAWLPRRPLGGTYDQAWLDSGWPAWPKDYSFSYHNSAPADLRVSPYLTGGEIITLVGFSEGGEQKIRLPQQNMMTRFATSGDGGWDVKNMNLDTVFLDLGARRQKDWRVYLTWRVNFQPDAYDSAVVELNVA